MASLMLINPSKRPSKRRRKASPAQLRALAKARRARAGLSTNPAPRRKRRHVMRATSHHTRRRARRNPIGTGGIMGQLMDAGMGAVGALATNAITNLLPLPASLQSGTAKEATKMAVAVALGMATKRMLGRKSGKMVEGALTVSAFNILNGMIPASMGGSAVPAAAVAGLGYMSPGANAGGALPFQNGSIMQGMGEYVSGMNGVGEYITY